MLRSALSSVSSVGESGGLISRVSWVQGLRSASVGAGRSSTGASAPHTEYSCASGGMEDAPASKSGFLGNVSSNLTLHMMGTCGGTGRRGGLKIRHQD